VSCCGGANELHIDWLKRSKKSSNGPSATFARLFSLSHAFTTDPQHHCVIAGFEHGVGSLATVAVA